MPERRLAWVSFSVNLLLALATYFLGAFSGSLALRADALHAAIDLASSLVLLLALYLVEKKAAGFPYGLYKVEDLAALVMAGLILLAGADLGGRAFGPPAAVRHLGVAVGGALALGAAGALFGLYKVRVAARSGSPSLGADGRHSWLDGLGTAAIGLGLAGGWLGVRLDRPLALLVVLLVLWGGLGILWDAVRGLLDEGLPRELADEIRARLSGDERLGVVTVEGRRAGRFWLAEVGMVPRTDPAAAAELAREWEARLLREIPRLARVRFELGRAAGPRLAALPVDASGRPAEKLGCAPRFLLVSLEDLSVRSWDNPVPEGRGRGRQVARELLGTGIDTVWTLEEGDDKAAFLLLRQHGVTVQKPPEEILARLRRAGVLAGERDGDPEPA